MVLALVAGGFTLLGVILKLLYDTLAARRASQKDKLERFSGERKEAYEHFLDLVYQERRYHDALRSLVQEHSQGRTEISEEDESDFPKSAKQELVTSLESIRRLARSHSIITVAEAIVRVCGDVTAAQRAALQSPRADHATTWFLLQRFLDDRLDDFLREYREDLGLGAPVGSPKRRFSFLRRNRSESFTKSEQSLRAQVPTPRTKFPT